MSASEWCWRLVGVQHINVVAKATLQKNGQNSQMLNFEFWVQEGHGHPPGPGRAQAGQKGHGRVLLSQATTRRPSTCGCFLRAPPPLSAKATSACFCRRRRRGDGIAGSRSARSTSARVRVRAVGLVLGLGSGLGLGLVLGLG